MSGEAERIYTINLGKVLLSPNNIRAKRAINVIREFTRHHMKVSSVLIDSDVSQYVWSRGIRHPPRKIRVGIERTDRGSARVYLYDEIEETVEDTSPEIAEADGEASPEIAEADGEPSESLPELPPMEEKPGSRAG